MYSLRLTIVLPFILGSILLIFFLVFYTYHASHYSMEDSVYLIAEERVNNTKMAMSWLFRSATSSAEHLATEHNLLSLFNDDEKNNVKLKEDLHILFEMLVQGNEFINSLVIVDENALAIESRNSIHVGDSYADKSYVQTALDGKIAYGDMDFNDKSKDLIMSVAVPIFFKDKIVGAVILTNSFPIFFSGRQDGSGGVKAIFNMIVMPNGKIVRKDDNQPENENIYYKELYDELGKSGTGGSVLYYFDEKEYVGYAAFEPLTKGVIVSSGEHEALLDYVTTLCIVVFSVSLFVLAIIIFMVMLRVNRILNMLFSLIKYAKKISEGDLEAGLKDYKRKDELSILHRSLKTMVGSMREMVIKSQEASNMKSEFIANMSHEMRTPLNAVIGISYLYLNGNNPSADKRDYVVKIQVAAKSLLGIINNILDISKIEAGMFELDSTIFNLKDVGKQVMTIHQDNSHEKKIDLRFEYDDDLPTYLVGDSIRIGQILNNLVGNALKFTEKGFVCLKFSQGKTVSNDDAEQFVSVAVTVTDSGLGIPSDKLIDLFKAFTQVDTSITRRYGGTGLGLTISDWLVNTMGGKLKVESVLGQGSTFSFVIKLLRVCEIKDISLDEEIEEQLCLKGKSILVAEDNEINQLIVQELLMTTEANAVIVGNGLLAVNAVQEQAFDLVLMDLQMPVMGGLKAAQEIRKSFSMEELPIVAVTANAMKENKVLSLESGINDYLTKPLEPKELMRTLRYWLLDR